MVKGFCRLFKLSEPRFNGLRDYQDYVKKAIKLILWFKDMDSSFCWNDSNRRLSFLCKQESRSCKNVVAIKSINGYGSSSCKSLNPFNQGSDNLQKGRWCAMR